MKLGILSTSPRCYSTSRLKEAALKRGHQCKVLDTLKFSIDVATIPIRLLLNAQDLSRDRASISDENRRTLSVR